MLKFSKVFLFALGIAYVAVGFFTFRGPFGIFPDLSSFTFFTVPFTILISLALTQLSSHLQHGAAKYLIVPLVGAVLGFIWTLFAAIILGPWFGAYSFPVIACWVLSGTAAGVAAASTLSIRDPRMAFHAGALLLLTFAASRTYEPFVATLRNERRLTVFYGRWEPHGQHLVARAPSSSTSKEMRTLKALLVAGNVTFTASTVGSGSPTRAYVVMRHQLSGKVRLRQPSSGTIFYIQDEDNRFRMYPPDAATLDRVIELEPAGHTKEHTWGNIELAGGGKSGTTAAIW